MPVGLYKIQIDFYPIKSSLVGAYVISPYISETRRLYSEVNETDLDLNEDLVSLGYPFSVKNQYRHQLGLGMVAD